MTVAAAPGIDAGLQIREYDPSDSDEAILLELRSAQGKGFQLRFDRPYYHRRAENFDAWRLVTARRNGVLVGVAGSALKPAIFQGRQTTAQYLFDVRVAPEARREGVAQRLMAELLAWGQGRAEIGYGFAVSDNHASLQLTTRWIGAGATPACCFLVYPTYRAGGRPPVSVAADAATVHASFLNGEGPFELYTDPAPAFASPAYVGSWVLGAGGARAGCSAWSNQEIFAEVVERVPRPLAALRSVSRTWPLSRLRWPHIPATGERLRSWYIFDFHACDEAAAAALMNDVAAEAKARGIDYCYIIHRPGQAWVARLRRGFPRPLAPVIPYSIIAREMGGRPLAVAAPYMDIRDV